MSEMSNDDDRRHWWDALWSVGALAFLVLVAVILKLGADNYGLRSELQIEQCKNAVWQAKRSGQPVPECKTR